MALSNKIPSGFRIHQKQRDLIDTLELVEQISGLRLVVDGSPRSTMYKFGHIHKSQITLEGQVPTELYSNAALRNLVRELGLSTIVNSPIVEMYYERESSYVVEFQVARPLEEINGEAKIIEYFVMLYLKQEETNDQ